MSFKYIIPVQTYIGVKLNFDSVETRIRCLAFYAGGHINN